MSIITYPSKTHSGSFNDKSLSDKRNLIPIKIIFKFLNNDGKDNNKVNTNEFIGPLNENDDISIDFTALADD